jgi:hypothetical protein
MYLIMDVTGLLLAYCNAMKDTQLPQAHPMKYRFGNSLGGTTCYCFLMAQVGLGQTCGSTDLVGEIWKTKICAWLKDMKVWPIPQSTQTQAIPNHLSSRENPRNGGWLKDQTPLYRRLMTLKASNSQQVSNIILIIQQQFDQNLQ